MQCMGGCADRFPKLMMENCAGGGGRNDLGMLQNFHWTQVSDEWGGVRTLKVLNGFSHGFSTRIRAKLCGFYERGKLSLRRYRFPISWPDVWAALPWGDCTGSLHFPASIVNAYGTMCRYTRPSFGRSCLQSWSITTLLSSPNTEPGDWIVLEHATPNHTKAYAGIFRLAAAKSDTYLFKPRGLDPALTYKVTFDNTGSAVRMEGIDLIQQGLSIRLANPCDRSCSCSSRNEVAYRWGTRSHMEYVDANIVVTGGCGDIGLAIARRLVVCGARVTLLDILPQKNGRNISRNYRGASNCTYVNM